MYLIFARCQISPSLLIEGVTGTVWTPPTRTEYCVAEMLVMLHASGELENSLMLSAASLMCLLDFFSEEVVDRENFA